MSVRLSSLCYLRQVEGFAFYLPFFILFTSCSHLLYQPDRILYLDPKSLNLAPKEIFLESEPGVRLFAWYFETRQPNSKGTIIRFHGNAQNMSSHYLSLTWLIEKGYNLFTFDYRGYGRSEGEPDQEGTYKDALAALNLAWELHKKQSGEKFIVYGQSLDGRRAMSSTP